ncbi:WG repeat-containing protein [Helcococcus bovis]|uniref:WG repeat-containing protein n=1 Tax=Helcococcus bovis TaxID=3153252 RepID=UPI0038B6EAEF
MNKLINLILIYLAIFLWILAIKKDYENDSVSKQYLKNGDMYFENQIYIDALENYKKSEDVKSDKNTRNKIFESYLELNNYKEAFNYLNSINFDHETIIKNQERILNKFIKEKDYKNYNKYMNLSDKIVYEKFNKKYYGKIIYLENFYDDVDYIVQDKDRFIVNSGGWKVINNLGKIISTKYDKIYGFYNNFITVSDKKGSVLIDENKVVRGKFFNQNDYNFQSGFVVVKNNDKYKYAIQTGEIKSKDYKQASNFQNDIAVVIDKGIQIINQNFEVMKKVDGDDFKKDGRNNAIYNNKIIVKNGMKYKLYDIKDEKYSKEYDEIDFDYGDLIAVKNKGKWGFIDQEFNVKIEFMYDEAKSFSSKVGIIKINDEDYIIDKNNNMLEKINGKLYPFNIDGISFVKQNEKYVMVKLMRSIYD